ncbi:MAG: MarR family transcriptional regulator [Bacteroidetes bacterium]|nr:MAG: MarR family transcriptional regulator [Bacteroidota bacterium]
MKKDISYQPLIAKWEDFLIETNHNSLEHFAVWLLKDRNAERQVQEINVNIDNYIKKNSDENNLGYKSGEASYLLTRLYKFMKFYTKPVFKEVGITNSDEFALLAHLDIKQTCTKKDIIIDNIIEVTTGIDMINRLVKQGFIEEKVNLADKREKIISITTSGRSLLFNVYQKFSTIQDVLVDLSIQERDVLLQLIKSLETFHTENYIKIVKKN